MRAIFFQLATKTQAGGSHSIKQVLVRKHHFYNRQPHSALVQRWEAVWHTTLCRGGEATSIVVIPHATRSSTYAWHDQESIGQQNSFANLYILIRVGPDNGSALFKSSCNAPARLQQYP